jgi:DNA-directed RNA polymerase subunit RPC12/RpoP
MSYQCIQCRRDLNPEITGMHPFWDGYICNKCRELADEEFCKAAYEYDAPPPEDAISTEELLKFI